MPGRSNSIPTRCRRCWSTSPISPKCRRRQQKPADKTYLNECLQNATWLMRALDQRAKTILKVSTEIVRQQDAFFAHGVQHLKPLNLKTVADAIGMHELTVSRVTANKYMATNRGIFELKYFFTSSISSSDGGEAHSAEAVRHRIKQMIDAETGARRPVRRHHRRQAARRRHRHCPPHRRQISRGDEDPVLGPAPARKADRAGRGGLICRFAFSRHTGAIPPIPLRGIAPRARMTSARFARVRRRRVEVDNPVKIEECRTPYR